MGNPDCDRCGKEVANDEPLIQVIAYQRCQHEMDEGGVEHVAYYHAYCWTEIFLATKPDPAAPAAEGE